MLRLFTLVALGVGLIAFSGCAPKKSSVKKIKKELKKEIKKEVKREPKTPSVKVLPAVEVGPDLIVPVANCSCK